MPSESRDKNPIEINREVSEVLLGELTVEEARRNGPNRVEVQKNSADGLLSELFEGFDLALTPEPASEDDRIGLYVAAASIFA